MAANYYPEYHSIVRLYAARGIIVNIQAALWLQKGSEAVIVLDDLRAVMIA